MKKILSTTIGLGLLVATLLCLAVNAQEASRENVEVTIQSIRRERLRDYEAVKIFIKVTNNKKQPIFFEMYHFTVPMTVHTANTEQLRPDGKWVYVGGAGSETPAPHLQKVSPGGHLKGVVRLFDPYPNRSVPGQTRLGDEIPIRGKHRIRLRYFSSEASEEAWWQLLTGKSKETPPIAISDPFEIPLK